MADARWSWREIEREIKKKIESYGFEKRGQGMVFERSHPHGFHGFIGFNRDRQRGSFVGVNPVLGVTCHDVFQRLCGLWENKLDRTNIDIVFSPLGYLTPERRFRDWHYTLGEDNTSVHEEMFGAIREYGLPFYEEYQSIDAMIEAIERRTFWHPLWAPYAYPVMLVMKDRSDEAKVYVEKERERRLGIGGGYEDDYQRFAGNFLRKLGAM